MTKLTGNGRPTMNTPGEVGQYYEDLNTGDIYECRRSSKYSPTHHAPVGGYWWELRVKGEDRNDHGEFFGGGTPEGGAPHQQLVTDDEGNAKWEDRLAYVAGLITIKCNPENSYSQSQTDGTILYGAGNDRFVTNPEMLAAFNVVGDDIFSHLGNGKTWNFYWDDSKHSQKIARLPVTITNPWPGVTKMQIYQSGTTAAISINYTEGSEHIFGFESSDYRAVPIAEEFIPSTVPVIQTATVGQTIAVKAVDANGKPTEWEAVDAGGSGGAGNLVIAVQRT